jgi:hypothetical protein
MMKTETAAPLILLAVVIVGWLGFTGVAVYRARLPGEASGMMLAAFPLRAADDDIFAAVAQAGGQSVRPTWFPGAWVVTGEGEGFADRLRQAGAWAAFGQAPVGLPTLGGCVVVSAEAKRPGQIRINP